MNILLNAAAAAADRVVYGLATRLFETQKSTKLAIILARAPRSAEVVVLINLLMISATLIWAKLTSQLPRIFTTSILIILLSCVATVAWVVIPHTPNFSSAGAHPSLTGEVFCMLGVI